MADQFDRFTPRTRHVLQLAHHEARRLNHPSIGPEHILLGLLLKKDVIATHILQALGVNLSVVRKRIAQLVEPGSEKIQGKLSLSSPTKEVIELAVEEALYLGYPYIGTEHLLIGLIRAGSGVAYQVLTEMGITLDQVHHQMQRLPREKTATPLLRLGASPKSSRPVLLSRLETAKVPLAVSPIFGIMVVITILAGYLTYQKHLSPSLTMFVFVTGGWLISLCLHEFGHALVAYWGGDEGVVDKGYLTLNPIKYTHPVLSIVLPVVYLALGGIGLPGGAVFIQPHALRSKGWQSLTAAAGPLATAVCAIALLGPFVMVGPTNRFDHLEFWAGLAFLASLQVSGVLFNLLPIPGLDGFGIIAPYLPEKALSGFRGFGSYTLVIIFVLFSNQTFSRGFWAIITFITSRFNLDYYLVYEGFSLFRFWAN